MLPSLDRLAGLIERVVELVDEVAGREAAPEPVGEPAPPREQPQPQAPEPAAPEAVVPEDVEPSGWLAFVPSPHGYTLVEQPGRPPQRGAFVELDGVRHRVVGHRPSPLPGDRRRCAVVEREEPPEPERTLDA